MKKRIVRTVGTFLASTLLIMNLAACGGASGDNTESKAESSAAGSFVEGAGDIKLSEDTTAEESKYGGTMRLNFNVATNSLDPAQFNANHNYVPGYHIYEAPVSVGNDGIVYPGVCTYSVSEDNLHITFTVRDNVKFHNGDTVNVDDVIASVARFLIYSTSGQTSFGNYIESTERVDDMTVTYHLTEVAPLALLTIGELKGGCKIMPAEIAEAHMEDYIVEDSEIVGTGPYMLKAWNRDVDLTLTRFEDYVPYESGGVGPAAAKQGYFDEIYISIASDQTARTNGMIAGNFDYSTSVLTDMAPQLEAAGCWSSKNWNGWSPTIIFNLGEANADSIVNNVDFRKAVRSCMDAEQILLGTKADSSQFEVGANPMMSSSVYYNAILDDVLEQNLDEAKSYLEASGYNGETIVWWCADAESYYTTALPASEMLKAIGVNVDLQILDVTTYESSYNDPTNGEFDIVCRETQKSYIHPLLSTFVSRYALWNTEERTEVISHLKSTAPGSSESLAAYEDYCVLLRDEVPYIILGDFGTVCWYSEKVVPDWQGADVYWWNSYFAK